MHCNIPVQFLLRGCEAELMKCCYSEQVQGLCSVYFLLQQYFYLSLDRKLGGFESEIPSCDRGLEIEHL